MSERIGRKKHKSRQKDHRSFLEKYKYQALSLLAIGAVALGAFWIHSELQKPPEELVSEARADSESLTRLLSVDGITAGTTRDQLVKAMRDPSDKRNLTGQALLTMQNNRGEFVTVIYRSDQEPLLQGRVDNPKLPPELKTDTTISSFPVGKGQTIGIYCSADASNNLRRALADTETRRSIESTMSTYFAGNDDLQQGVFHLRFCHPNDPMPNLDVGNYGIRPYDSDPRFRGKSTGFLAFLKDKQTLRMVRADVVLNMQLLIKDAWKTGMSLIQYLKLAFANEWVHYQDGSEAESTRIGYGAAFFPPLENVIFGQKSPRFFNTLANATFSAMRR